ncbi:MAG TPA: glycosyltransferase family 2 protein [Gammaproteobacteria bacterium]|nr:glycosyltransferase family 2 protein [Gammaproteobacteria bacterium]
MNPSIDIIIVNWNAGLLLRNCLKSIVTASRDGFSLGRVVVVDNGSSDDSLVDIDKLSLPLDIIRNSVNRGFGAACNQGAAACDAPYLLFLNPDTRLFENSLVVPHAYLEDPSNHDAGICGIQLIDEKGHVARNCAHFPSLMRFAVQSIGLNKIQRFGGAGVHMFEWDHLSDRSVDHVIGAFFFMRRSLYNELNGFDERFFVYLEDIDFSLRAKRAGWMSVYITGAQAFHAEGGTSRQVMAKRLFYSLRSRLQYGFKHFSPSRACALLLITLFVEPLTRLVFLLLSGNISDIRNTLSGFSLLYRDLSNIIGQSHGDSGE